MEKKELFPMAEQLKLPEPVLSPLVAAAKSLPEGLPIEELTEPETAAAAWKTVSAQLPAWREDNGMAQLAVMLAAVCQTEKRYRRENIPAEVFLSTMDCFRRFLEETHARTGQWAFDRGSWTWRQTGGLLFRLGTLEFEYRRIRPGLDRRAWRRRPLSSAFTFLPTQCWGGRSWTDPTAQPNSFSLRRNFVLGANQRQLCAGVGSWPRL